MIQRIQSLFLFFAAMLNGALLLPSMILAQRTVPGAPVMQGYPPRPAPGTTAPVTEVISTGNHFVLLILAALVTLLPLVAIFLFKNRPRQRGLVWLAVLGVVGFLTAFLMTKQNLEAKAPRLPEFSYSILGGVLPVAGLVLLILAIRGIRKDEKLLKSLDRLR